MSPFGEKVAEELTVVDIVKRWKMKVVDAWMKVGNVSTVIMRSCRHIPLSIECHHSSQHIISNFQNIYSFHLSERRLVVNSSGKSKTSRVSSAKIPVSSLTNLIFPGDL